MLIVKVWCLPSSTEDELWKLHKAIVSAAIEVKAFKVRDENDMVCLFPPDQMEHGLGSEIVIDVCVLKSISPAFAMDWSSLAWEKNRLAQSLGEAVRKLYPKAKIVCSVSALDPEKDGHWQTY